MADGGGVKDWVARFGAALTAGDATAASELFADECYWRDLVAFTWNIVTVEGRDGVRDMLAATLERTAPSGWRITEEGDGEAWLAFETAVGRGLGVVRLAEDGRAFTLMTTMEELKGHEERQGPARPKGVVHGAERDRESWLEAREREQAELGFSAQPEVLVIGGGQGGVALGARLRQLGVPTIIADRHPRPGDSWRTRYKSLCLHDPVWYDHLPYIKFPANWPIFSPKDKIADWLEMYARVMELNYWGSTEVRRARRDGDAWEVDVVRDGQPLTLRPRQLVFATGMAAWPVIPSFPGADAFRGDQHHSSKHAGPEAYRGKRVVVIGSNNSAHDICAALWEHGADVTMVQRSPTTVVRADTLMDIAMGPLYSEQALANGITTEKADLIAASLPYRLAAAVQIPVTEQIREHDADFYARLEAAGFRVDWGEDGSGLHMKYLRRASGYYIDVGASGLIADGSIKLATGQVAALSEDAVVLEDGTSVPADVVVYATGYGSMNGFVAEIVDRDTADRVGKVWGLGSGTAKDPGPWEGEERNMWKPTQEPGLWFHGGNLAQSRLYSLYLALQLKARAEGIDTPVYGLADVHHTS
jgi:putative flavoprotein involved in K+ transport